MVQPAVTDVIGPTVAAHDPDAASSPGCPPPPATASPRSRCRPPAFASGPPRARAGRKCPPHPAGRPQMIGDTGHRPASAPAWQEFAAKLALLVDRDPEPQAELGVVLEQGVAPGGSAAVGDSRNTASSAGCRRKSRSNRWRWQSVARSPNNCVSSLRYGVSPQPAQAPLNSNNGA
jgi:hypothetical protein